MSETLTVGEHVERHGFCQVIMAIVALAERVGRIPVGEWAYTFTSDPRYRLFMNGGTSDLWEVEPGIRVPRFYAYVEFNGWPAALCNAAGGTVTMDEGQLMAAIHVEHEQRTGPVT